MAEQKRQGMLSLLDFCIEVFKEKIDGKGEDSFYYSALPGKALFGVFDGCGGSGARRYEKLQGRTGAYMASRVASGATKDWFDALTSDSIPNTETLAEKMQEYLAICKREGEAASSIKGKMSKAFPTTAAVIVCTPAKSKISATCIWAGDSRCYRLDSSGLMQLTDDDISGLDAMENLTADGGLTNVISASSRINLHEKRIDISSPCIIFAATDGCFGYLSTPMEFEYLLLDTLLRAKSIVEWERDLKTFLQSVAGDDFSLCGCSFGYGSFETLQSQFKQRRSFLLSEYIEGIEKKTIEEKTSLWHDYSVHYSRHLNKSYPSDAKQPSSAPTTPQMSPGSSAGKEVQKEPASLKAQPQKEDNVKTVTQKAEETHKPKGLKKPTDLD